MSFNIDTFKSRFEEGGFLQSNKFEVLVTPPRFLGGRSINNNGVRTSSYEISDMLRFRIEATRVPGIQLLFADNHRYGVGPTQKQPFSAQLNEISINFIVDYKSILWKFWHNWVNNIFNHSGTSNVTNFSPTYLAKYKDDFSTLVEILIYANDGALSQRVSLLQAFPTAITDIPLSWAEQSNKQDIFSFGVNLFPYSKRFNCSLV